MNAMRRDAKAGLFNTIVVHKWDRFARNRVESTIVKTLLRAEYGVQIYSVIEQSQDDGLGSDGILMRSSLGLFLRRVALLPKISCN